MDDLSPPFKFTQESENPVSRNINFEAFKVIEDFSGHHVESLVRF